MKLALTLALVLSACVDLPDTSSIQQKVCRDDPDTCPGGHPITPKQFTINDAVYYAPLYGIAVTATPAAACDAIHCWANINTGTQQFRADCYDFVTVAWCEHTVCNLTYSDDDVEEWSCHQAPPLD